MTNCGDTVADWNGGIVDWIDVAVYWRGFYKWNVFKWTCSKSEHFDNCMVHFVCEAVRWLFTNVQLAKFSWNWNWMAYRLVACVCSWCCSVGWWWCECYKLNLNGTVDTNKWSNFHIRAKKNFECSNITSSDGMKSYDYIWSCYFCVNCHYRKCNTSRVIRKSLTHLPNKYEYTQTGHWNCIMVLTVTQNFM